ncbi:glycosyltransferase family 2 protein [Candidatus Omnitrophota bacterium]
MDIALDPNSYLSNRTKEENFENEPLVSILVPTYNGREVIGDCLNSVLKINYSDFRVVVIDDCSRDDTISFIKENYPTVEVFKTRKKLGFAGTVNLGIRKTMGDIIVLLNMDTVVDKLWLKSLIDALISDKTVGLVGSKIFSADGKTLQHAGGLLRENGISAHIGKGELDRGQYNDSKDVDYLCGASLAFRRDILNKIGFFDEGYKPLYYEDVDFAYRARSKGFKIRYVPGTVLFHKENVSTNGLSDRFYFFYHRSRLRFIFKHYSFSDLITKFFTSEKKWFFNELPLKLRRVVFKTYIFSLFPLMGVILKSRLLKRGDCG